MFKNNPIIIKKPKKTYIKILHINILNYLTYGNDLSVKENQKK